MKAVNHQYLPSQAQTKSRSRFESSIQQVFELLVIVPFPGKLANDTHNVH